MAHHFRQHAHAAIQREPAVFSRIIDASFLFKKPKCAEVNFCLNFSVATRDGRLFLFDRWRAARDDAAACAMGQLRWVDDGYVAAASLRCHHRGATLPRAEGYAGEASPSSSLLTAFRAGRRARAKYRFLISSEDILPRFYYEPMIRLVGQALDCRLPRKSQLAATWIFLCWLMKR